ncbi:hypothetical protein [Parapedobacter koreensis]|uniref:Uncharacterized protein n=1 Tax=Parapedobacter koreensis TaxID=332977 RepID=A0A1H7RL26_9SPHI|nr:hypothetical protein [Parapedobacter koreensis]SEL60825.1 hypothetical protein SAMN05421740_107174 [Parapedobacter koreensis]
MMGESTYFLGEIQIKEDFAEIEQNYPLGVIKIKVMLKNPTFAIIAVTAYLIIFVAMTRLYPDPSLLFAMYSLSPLLVIWMVYTIIRYGHYDGPELREDQEWGYEKI